jgi:hypothetical protein
VLENVLVCTVLTRRVGDRAPRTSRPRQPCQRPVL